MDSTTDTQTIDTPLTQNTSGRIFVSYKRIMAIVMIATATLISGLFLMIDSVAGGPIGLNPYIALFITLAGGVYMATVVKLLKGSGWVIE